MKDLQNPKWMYLKAGMFVLIGTVSAGLIIAAIPTIQTLVLLALTVWSFCRVYYFAFYVLERYVDPSFRFSGMVSALNYCVGRTRKSRG
jgi:hypothetical protein